MMVRVRVCNGDGAPMGEIQASVDSAQRWLMGMGDPESRELHNVRDLVDPGHEGEDTDWDLWARPAEVAADLDEFFV